MGSFHSHMKNIQELENGNIDKLKSELVQKEECEVKTYAVSGRSEDLELGSNQPVSSPIDPMHQFFLCVANYLLPYHHNEMDPHHNAEINSFLEHVDLPKEFKTSVWSLEDFEDNFQSQRDATWVWLVLTRILKIFVRIWKKKKNVVSTKDFVSKLKVWWVVFVNHSGRVIKNSEIKCVVGFLSKKTNYRIIDNWSLVEGKQLLFGVASWNNLSCLSNCDFYNSGSFKGRECSSRNHARQTTEFLLQWEVFSRK